ncbi:hypothetical protein ACOMHN_034237 [Nucella lapillus]
MAAPEFIPTNRGGRKLLLNGYLYVLNRKHENFVFWRCIEYKTCPATVTTATAYDTIQYLGKNHHHEPDLAKVEVIRRTADLKNAVKTQMQVPVKRLFSEAFTAADNVNKGLVAARPTFRNPQRLMTDFEMGVIAATFLWLMYEDASSTSHKQYGERSNNHLESFHAAFNRTFHTVHPNIFIFVSGLKKRQDETETTVASLDAGNAPPPQKRQQKNKEDRIRRVLQQYQAGQRQ